MKIATIIVRVALGLLLLFAAISYFLKLGEEPKMGDAVKTMNEGFAAMIYFMPLVKTVELLCGLSYVSGKFLKLFNLVLLPVSLHIFLINIYLMPTTEGLLISGFLFFGNLFLIYTNWESYKHLLKA